MQLRRSLRTCFSFLIFTMLHKELCRCDGCGGLGQIKKEPWNLSSILQNPIRMADPVSQLLHEKLSERFPSLPAISGKHHIAAPAVAEPDMW